MSHVEAGQPPSPPWPAKRPAGDKLDEWNRKQWADGIFSAWAGITIAATSYVPIAFLLRILLELAATGGITQVAGVSSLPRLGLDVLVASMMSAPVGFVIGGGLLIVCSLPVLWLKLHRHVPLLGTLVGGAAGGICSLLLIRGTHQLSVPGGQLCYFLIVPGLATLLGQIGGGWGICWRPPGSLIEARPFRFCLRDALLLITLTAAFLGMARWGLEPEAPWYAPLLVWVVFQTGTAWLVMQILTWCNVRPRVGSAVQPSLE